MRDRILTKVQATVGFVSGVTAPKLVNHKRIYTPKDIIVDIREFYGVQISYQQAWRAKECALEMIRGCIFPLAYGVVDTENDGSWTWFFEQFKNAFGEREEMCVVSYRNESILKSVRIAFPNVPHYACIRHLWKNVCGNFKRTRNTLSDLFYSMAKAYRKEDFDKLMVKVDKVDHRVKEYLEDAGYEKWSRVHSTNSWKKLEFYLVLDIAKQRNNLLYKGHIEEKI
ncbi:hypothetical protein KY290_012979 [Solanum tuberosum]|uniref:MULE transposase domain-containing protein n=1 Tax=Solanum tuberosum TaxID=4113 RepID=A0ABQ7VKR0_SOLTU|nr:hypothetical protein KY285_012743 [Solanum tuberosum]KAH0768998.1 hypothetical protein KY290_012979 [Solanum tuberosum]